MEFDGYDEHGNITLAMVIIVMLHNHTSHVWHRLDANLEMNRYNKLGTKLKKMYSSTSGFYAKGCQANSTYKALHDPWCHFIFGL